MLGIIRLYLGMFFAMSILGIACAQAPCPRQTVEQLDPKEREQIISQHETWAKNAGWNHPGSPGKKANLCKIDLSSVDLAGRYLLGVDLRGANLDNAIFDNAHLDGADLENAEIHWTSMRKTVMKGADLAGADLVGPDMTGAILDGINLTNAKVFGANFSDASFFNVNIESATFRPAGAPEKGELAGLKGLLTVTFAPDPYDKTQPLEEQISGVVLFRKDFQESGLENLERDATYVIERARTREELNDRNLLVRLGGYARLVLFEWTTEYGRVPWLAIVIMLTVMATLSLVYFFALWNFTTGYVRPGIVRYEPEGGLITGDNGAPQVLANATAQTLNVSFAPAIWFALYFSILSMFRIGWRELNFGSWIENIQSSDFQLRPMGWIRCVAGFQSLLSVYLLAIWALTEFGQPFE